MEKKKTITASMVLISFAVAIFIVGVVKSHQKLMIEGDYPYYPDVQSITDAADVIIVGEVVTSKYTENLMVDMTPDKESKEETPYTISTVKVTEVLKGNINVGDTITIKQLGNYINQPEATLYEIDGYLKTAQNELMFLAEYENSPYSAVNPAQGMVEVIDGNILYSASRYSLWGYDE